MDVLPPQKRRESDGQWLVWPAAGQKHDAVTFRTLLNAAAKQGSMWAQQILRML